jgi:glycosyltransferase involved in cell wall biosynthesis
MRIALITARNPLAPAADRSDQPAYLARALAHQGHQVTIYARRDGTSPHTAVLGRGVSVEHIEAGPARELPSDQAARHMPQMAAALEGKWRARPPDVVHAFGWVGGLAALGAVRGTQIPVVQSFGSLAAAERRHADHVGRPVCASRLRLETLIGRKAAAVLASSSAEAADLARLAVPRPAIRVVPAGVDTDVFAPEGKRAARTSRIRLVTIAASDQAPGLRAVVRATAQVPDAELVIVGGPDSKHLPRTGPFRELARLAAELKIRSRITFAGELSPARLAAVLRSADVLVSAAPYDPAGAAAIQAMACGTPVVVSAVGGNADAVIDGTTGLLIEPEHAGMLAHRLRRLLSTPALLTAYGIAAADRARSRYSWDRIGRETAAAYERCLPGREAAEYAAEAEEAAAAEAGGYGDTGGYPEVAGFAGPPLLRPAGRPAERAGELAVTG